MSWESAVNRRLPDGRLHLQHGPIDLIIEAHADQHRDVELAYWHATQRFDTVLEELVGELPLLRTALSDAPPPLKGTIARRMLSACWPYRNEFITLMAAVAGSVADEILECMMSACNLRKAYVNNGGDIALHLAAGERFQIGIADVSDGALNGDFVVDAATATRGIATSGWRGRSLSLGIADAVTVTAINAAAADAAATMIANAVNVTHAAIQRLPAREVKEDSDLLDLLVTVTVGPLPSDVIDTALDNGLARALELQQLGLIHAAHLRLQGHTRTAQPIVHFDIPIALEEITT